MTASITTTALSLSSREIADLCEKRHDNVMADINKMLAEIDLDVLPFQGIYNNARSRDQTEFLLPKDLTVTGAHHSKGACPAGEADPAHRPAYRLITNSWRKP